MKIIEKRLDEIRPYERNPRRNDAAVQYVAESIRQFGWKQPIVIDRDGVIIVGHTRYKAAYSLGLETVPCIIADDLTPEQVKAYRLADNKVGEIAGWDFDALEEELDALDLDMTAFGFDDLDKELKAEREKDDTYTSKTEIPQYEPSENETGLTECCDDLKYRELLREIAASKLEDEEKSFMCLAAARHLQFNYKKIADYYASSASAEMQRLMEKSALVIIDYGDAIKNGYAVLRKTVTGLLNDE